MNKKLAKEILKEYRDKYPNLCKVSIRYEGSGDSFNDFWDFDFIYKDKERETYDEDEVKREFLDRFDDVIGILWDKVAANFNDDGSEGTFTIDLKNLDLNMDCYEKYTDTRFKGKAGYFEKK